MRATMNAGFTLLVTSLVCICLLASGCRDAPRLVEKVAFAVSPNLEFIEVSVDFGPQLKSDLEGAFPISRYGELFINPWTEVSPFSAGFRLNTNVFNDQDLIRLVPTSVLPNGSSLPLPINAALVAVRSPTPVHEEVDPLGYVDVLGRRWLGAAAEVTALSRALPEGLALAHDFFADTRTGKPAIVAAVYGPAPKDSGYEATGGVAFFGDAGRLIELWRNRRDERAQRAEAGLMSAASVTQFRLVDRAPKLKVRVIKR